MSTKKWYQFLLDSELLKETSTDGTQSYRVCRAERLSPNIDWKITWSKVRFTFFSSSTATFLWKLLHELLTTEERLCNTLGNLLSSCRFGCPGQKATLMHWFFECIQSKAAGSWVLGMVQNSCPLAEGENILKLNFSASNSLFCVTVNALKYIWNIRTLNKKVNLHLCQINLRTEALKLNETIHEYLVQTILEIVDPDSTLSVHQVWKLRLRSQRYYFITNLSFRQLQCQLAGET